MSVKKKDTEDCMMEEVKYKGLGVNGRRKYIRMFKNSACIVG